MTEALDPDPERAGRASATVRNHAIASLGTAVAAGVLPIPLVGTVLLGGIHLHMVHSLATIYEVEYSEQRANAIIGALIGISAAATGTGLLGWIPGAGVALGALGIVALPSASTYALGKVFIKHFASGGTFLTFDPDRARVAYDEALAEHAAESYAGVKP